MKEINALKTDLTIENNTFKMVNVVIHYVL